MPTRRHRPRCARARSRPTPGSAAPANAHRRTATTALAAPPARTRRRGVLCGQSPANGPDGDRGTAALTRPSLLPPHQPAQQQGSAGARSRTGCTEPMCCARSAGTESWTAASTAVPTDVGSRAQGQRPRRTRSCGTDRLPLVEAKACRMRAARPRASIPTEAVAKELPRLLPPRRRSTPGSAGARNGPG